MGCTNPAGGDMESEKQNDSSDTQENPTDEKDQPLLFLTLESLTGSFNTDYNNSTSFYLRSLISPETENQSVIWSSSDPDIASVASYGGSLPSDFNGAQATITAKAFGYTTITATSVADSQISESVELAIGYVDHFNDSSIWGTSSAPGYVWVGSYESTGPDSGLYNIKTNYDGATMYTGQVYRVKKDDTNRLEFDSQYDFSVDIIVDSSDNTDGVPGHAQLSFNRPPSWGYPFDKVHINSDGEFSVNHQASSYIPDVVTYIDYTYSPVIKTDGSSNTVKICQDTDSFTLYINDVEMGKWSNEARHSDTNGFEFGSYGPGGPDPYSTKVSFTNISVYPVK